MYNRTKHDLTKRAGALRPRLKYTDVKLCLEIRLDGTPGNLFKRRGIPHEVQDILPDGYVFIGVSRSETTDNAMVIVGHADGSLTCGRACNPTGDRYSQTGAVAIRGPRLQGTDHLSDLRSEVQSGCHQKNRGHQKAPPFSLVAGTVYAPDSYTIPTVSVHWICKGVKQGIKKLERLGIIV